MIKPATTNHAPHGRCPRQRKAQGPKSLSGPSNRQPRHPTSEPLSCSRGRHRTVKPPPRSRVSRPLRQVPSLLEGVEPPRASSHLARGSQPLVWASASLEASLNPQRHDCPPDQGIKGSDTSWAPRSKANPRHVSLVTPPGCNTRKFHQNKILLATWFSFIF
jgi:hypothetical protein